MSIEKIVFNPFDDGLKMNWNIWIPGRVNLDHLPVDGRVCLLLDRKDGNVYMKGWDEVTIEEFHQLSGCDAVIAVCHEKECY